MEGSDDPMYLLQISINPGAPLGGSISEYFPGAFNGTHFTAVDGAARINDFGKDNYAGQFFYGIPGNEKQVSMAWVSDHSLSHAFFELHTNLSLVGFKLAIHFPSPHRRF